MALEQHKAPHGDASHCVVVVGHIQAHCVLLEERMTAYH